MQETLIFFNLLVFSYVATPGLAGDGSKAILWGHDIFGPTSGIKLGHTHFIIIYF